MNVHMYRVFKKYENSFLNIHFQATDDFPSAQGWNGLQGVRRKTCMMGLVIHQIKGLVKDNSVPPIRLQKDHHKQIDRSTSQS